jgi:tryptophan synthase alpha subunit
MPHRFLLLKMLEHYDLITEGEKADSALKKKLVKDLKTSKIEFVYICTDTSADKALRDHCSNQPFTTYFLVGLNVADGVDHPDTIIVHLINHIKQCGDWSLVDTQSSYQVFTFE